MQNAKCRSKVVHYIGNRVPFGMQITSDLYSPSATDPGSIPGCNITSCDWESHRAAHNWPRVVRVWPGQAAFVNKKLFLTDLPSQIK